MVSYGVATTAYLQKLASDRADYIEWVIKYRRYCEGDTPDVISQRQKELILGNDFFGTGYTVNNRRSANQLINPNRPRDLHYKINVCDLVVSSESDRLNIRDMQVVARNEQQSQDLSALVRRWRKQSRMDMQDNRLHHAACRDGDSYLIAEYDVYKGRPVLTMNQAFDGETGVDMIYMDNDPMKPLYATKRWVDQQMTTTGKRMQRLNIYLPDRVLKLVMGQPKPNDKNANAGWQPYTAEGEIDTVGEHTLNGFTFEAGIMWWTTTQTEGGEPMGLPVFHYAHTPPDAYGRSTLADVVPDLQDRLNRSAAALEYANLFAGFNIIWTVGYKPPAPDDPNQRPVQSVPGMMINLHSPEASIGQLMATDLNQLITAKDSCFRDIAILTKTPLPILNPSGQIAAEGTLQQLEAPLVTKCEKAQIGFGNTHEDVARFMLKMEAVFGQRSQIGLTLAEIDDLEINCEWKDAKTRNESTEIANAQTKRALGVPDEQLWSELSYSPEQIEGFKTNQQLVRNAVISQLAATLPTDKTQPALVEATA